MKEIVKTQAGKDGKKKKKNKKRGDEAVCVDCNASLIDSEAVCSCVLHIIPPSTIGVHFHVQSGNVVAPLSSLRPVYSKSLKAATSYLTCLCPLYK